MTAHAIHADGYGNVTLNLDASMLTDGPLRQGERFEVRAPDGVSRRCTRTFADVEPGELLIYQTPTGRSPWRSAAATPRATLALSRTRSDAATPMIGTPAVHYRAHGLDQRAGEGARGGAPGGLVVTADEQTAGRGRQGRAWTAPPRSAVLMSVVLRPTPGETAAAGRGRGRLRSGQAVDRAAIKWPNDVWIEGRKVAGSWSRLGRRKAGR